jgi:hypothetical protein
MVSKTRRKRKLGTGKRRKRMVRKRVILPIHYGGALTDYLPSLSTVASYVPGYSTAKNYYDTANKTYQTGKDLYNTYNTKIKPAVDLYNQFYNTSDPKLSTNNPPPLPAGGPPPLSRADQLHNKRLRDIKERGARNAEANRKIMEQFNKSRGQPANGPDLPGFIQKARAIRPISFIDNALKVTGQRDRVRNFLNSKGLSGLVTGADLAIQSGFGKRRKRRVRKSYGGSKTKRRIRKRGRVI